jgi:hypothetical protein
MTNWLIKQIEIGKREMQYKTERCKEEKIRLKNRFEIQSISNPNICQNCILYLQLTKYLARCLCKNCHQAHQAKHTTRHNRTTFNECVFAFAEAIMTQPSHTEFNMMSLRGSFRFMNRVKSLTLSSALVALSCYSYSTRPCSMNESCFDASFPRIEYVSSLENGDQLNLTTGEVWLEPNYSRGSNNRNLFRITNPLYEWTMQGVFWDSSDETYTNTFNINPMRANRIEMWPQYEASQEQQQKQK